MGEQVSKPRRRKRRKKRAVETTMTVVTGGPVYTPTYHIDYYAQPPAPLSTDKIRRRFHQLKQRAANAPS